MILDRNHWFRDDERKTKGYIQIEQRLYFIQHTQLTETERNYEMNVLEQLVAMIPNDKSREVYLNKIMEVKK